LFGIVASVEAFFAASRGQRSVLKYYAIFMVFNTVANVVVGATVLSGIDLQCTYAQNKQGCSVTALYYGLAMLLGGSSVGVFAAINSALVYLTMKRSDAGADTDAKKLEL
jgi:heme A synthase